MRASLTAAPAAVHRPPPEIRLDASAPPPPLAVQRPSYSFRPSQHRVLVRPRSYGLEREAGTQHHGVLPVSTRNLQTNGQAVAVETRGDRDGWVAGVSNGFRQTLVV